MKISFDSMDPVILANFYGGEKQFVAKMHRDENNKILKGTLIPGASIGYHCHADSSEIIFVLSGEGIVNDNGEEMTLRAGDCHYCARGEHHSLRNEGTQDLIFYAVVPQS